MDESTQVYQRDLINDEREICCQHATCSMRIPVREVSRIKTDFRLPSSLILTSDDVTMDDIIQDSIEDKVEHDIAPEIIPLKEDVFESIALNLLEYPPNETNSVEEKKGVELEENQTVEETKQAHEDQKGEKTLFVPEHTGDMELDDYRTEHAEEEIIIEKVSSTDNRILADLEVNESVAQEDSLLTSEAQDKPADDRPAEVSSVHEIIIAKNITPVQRAPAPLKPASGSEKDEVSSEDKNEEELGPQDKTSDGEDQSNTQTTEETTPKVLKEPSNWKYDGIDQPFRTIQPAEDRPVTSSIVVSESIDSLSNQPPGTSFWSHRLSGFSNKYSDVIPDKKRIIVNDENQSGSVNKGSEMSDVFSVDTLSFPGEFTPPPLITRNRIIAFMMDRKVYIYKELQMFRDQLKEESLFVSSLFIFLLYYFFYFIFYCGVVHKCVCEG